MMAYLSYFRLRFVTGLQYRAAAIAGVATQLFFGLVFVMIYLTFYESDTSNTPMELSQLISYLWLNQSLFALVGMFYKDKDIFALIKNGNVSYELCRPLNLYFMWYSKIISTRVASVSLRCFPALLIAFILPSPYNLRLPVNIYTLLAFLLSLIIGTLLMATIVMLYHIIGMFTLDEKGITGIVVAVADIFSGLVVPIPFFPSFLQKVSDLLPFKYVSDLPFRIYTSHIPLNEALPGILIQISWIVILVLIGYFLSKLAIKKAVVQGG